MPLSATQVIWQDSQTPGEESSTSVGRLATARAVRVTGIAEGFSGTDVESYVAKIAIQGEAEDESPATTTQFMAEVSIEGEDESEWNRFILKQMFDE